MSRNWKSSPANPLDEEWPGFDAKHKFGYLQNKIRIILNYIFPELSNPRSAIFIHEKAQKTDSGLYACRLENNCMAFIAICISERCGNKEKFQLGRLKPNLTFWWNEKCLFLYLTVKKNTVVKSSNRVFSTRYPESRSQSLQLR